MIEYALHEAANVRSFFKNSHRKFANLLSLTQSAEPWHEKNWFQMVPTIIHILDLLT